MAVKRKFYVVWAGFAPGIYDSWEECEAQVRNFPDARYKSFLSLEEATEAYRGDPREYTALFRSMAAHKAQVVNYGAFPEICTGAIAVDAACSGNPGPVEYRGVIVGTGEQVFKVGPMAGGSNNIGEYLAIIHAAALLAQKGDRTTTIYTDSRTALSWVCNRRSKTRIAPTAENSRILELLRRADVWIATHAIPNPVLKWDTEKWGEIPADFGRK